MKPMRPDPEIRVRKPRIPTPGGGIPALLLSPRETVSEATGILWLHGGGYFAGSKEMVHASRAARAFFEHRGYRLVRAQAVERRGETLENFVMEKELI